MESIKKRKLLTVVYIATIFYALHNFTTYFIFADFLDQYFSKSLLSVIFALGAISSILISNFFGDLLKRYTNFKTLSFVISIQFIINIALALANYTNPYIIALLAILHTVFTTMIWISINIFIEEFSDHENIGSIRGTVLTVYHFQAIIAPFMSAQFLNLFGYSGLFLISALLLIPLYFITYRFFNHVKEPKYKHINLRESFRIVWKNRDIRGVIASSFIINSFYAAINIYMILYLTKILNIPTLLYIGLITPISVIPFILIPYELGKYSDELFGEKKAMLFGIFLTSIVMMSLYLFNIESTNIFFWIIVLFVARLGASITETENYAYFYKKIDGKSAGLIALFQNMSNIGFVFIASIGAIFFGIFDFDIKIIFLLVGLMGILSIFIIVKIHDINKKRQEKIDFKNNLKNKISINNEQEIEDRDLIHNEL